MQRSLGVAQRLTQQGEGCLVAVIAIDVVEQRGEPVEGCGVETAVLFEAAARAFAELLQVPAGATDADHRDIEAAAPDQRLQRRKDLVEGEVAGGAEEDEGVGGKWLAHRASPLGRGAPWPPNCWRSADRTRSAKAALPRELKRW